MALRAGRHCETGMVMWGSGHEFTSASKFFFLEVKTQDVT